MERETYELTGREREQFADLLDLQPGEKLVSVLRRTMPSYYFPVVVLAVLFWIIMAIVQAILLTELRVLIDPGILAIVEAIIGYVILAWVIGFAIVLAAGKPCSCGTLLQKGKESVNRCRI